MYRFAVQLVTFVTFVVTTLAITACNHNTQDDQWRTDSGLALVTTAKLGVSDTSPNADTGTLSAYAEAKPDFRAEPVAEPSLKKVAANGFTYPLDSLTSWDNGTYGACGTSNYLKDLCHTGNDLTTSYLTSVYAIGAGTVLAVSYTANPLDLPPKVPCSSGWGKNHPTGVCNMGLAIQHYSSSGEPFIAIYGHLVYSAAIKKDSIVAPGAYLGQIADLDTWDGTKWVSGSDHLHFGVLPGKVLPGRWGNSVCYVSQPAGPTLPAGCLNYGLIQPGTYIGTRSQVIPPTAPTLTLPVSLANTGTTVTFTWAKGLGTYRSHLMVCTDAALLLGCINPDGFMTGVEPAALLTTYTATGLTKGVHYWAVRGIGYTDYGGWGLYSPSRKFTVL